MSTKWLYRFEVLADYMTISYFKFFKSTNRLLYKAGNYHNHL